VVVSTYEPDEMSLRAGTVTRRLAGLGAFLLGGLTVLAAMWRVVFR
jgi:hypothetical protein